MGTIPAYPTFVAGENPTAAKLNSIKAAGDFWGLTPRCYAYQAAAQSLATGATPVILFDAEVYDIVQSGDTQSHDLVSNTSRLVVRTSGKYEITGQIQIAASAAGTRAVQVRLNAAGNSAAGTLITTNQQSPVTGISTSVSMVPVEVPLTAGDYLEMFATQTSGGALNTIGGQGVTFLRMKLSGS